MIQMDFMFDIIFQVFAKKDVSNSGSERSLTRIQESNNRQRWVFRTWNTYLFVFRIEILMYTHNTSELSVALG